MSIVQFQPHARLLTMLGEQLIGDARVAVVELVKNSYDADASAVTIEINDQVDKPFIRITDDGEGMDGEILEKVWAQPATPYKTASDEDDRLTEYFKRPMQGEKGIGRFALLKLGKDIDLVTRRRDSNKEFSLRLDLSGFDSDFVTKDGKARPDGYLLSEIEIAIAERAPERFTKAERLNDVNPGAQFPDHGTEITIRALQSNWGRKSVGKIANDLFRLQAMRVQHRNVKESGDSQYEIVPETGSFQTNLYYNGTYVPIGGNDLERLNALINAGAVLRITKGRFDNTAQALKYSINGEEQTVNLNSPEFLGLKIIRDYLESIDVKPNDFKAVCGPFEFAFFIFDFRAHETSRHHLNNHEKSVLKNHRIYLYRDGLRVYPYGDPDNDWLEIDSLRGTLQARLAFSNDQLVGFVNITHRNNPALIDKTSREGLIDTGRPRSDFITLIQAFLSLIRSTTYAKYLEEKSKKKYITDSKKGKPIDQQLKKISDALKDNPKLKSKVDKISMQYSNERSWLETRAENAEELAGVGLSVETASHDIVSLADKALSHLRSLMEDPKIHRDVRDRITPIAGLLQHVHDHLVDIQSLFRPARRRRKNIKVSTAVDKVYGMVKASLAFEKIDAEIVETGEELVVLSTEGVLLQVLLNLFDNAIYWLRSSKVTQKRIRIEVDGTKRILVFSDNGPGVHSDYAESIFDPFFSGKGEAGKGLGLYIARALLGRHDFDIMLYARKDRGLTGATFKIDFGETDV